MMMKNRKCLSVHHGAEDVAVAVVAVGYEYAYDELSAEYANMDVTTHTTVSTPFLHHWGWLFKSRLA